MKIDYFALIRQPFSSNSGLSSLKYHLEKEHNLTFGIKNQKKKHKCKKLDSLLVDWIVDDQQPFQVVVNKRFVKLVDGLNPSYKLPVRQTVNKIIDSKYEKIYNEKIDYLRTNNGKNNLLED